MILTPSKLRENIFQLLDQVLESGEIIEIKRKGQILKIVPPKRKHKLDNLIRREDALNGSSDDIVEMDWSEQWTPFI